MEGGASRQWCCQLMLQDGRLHWLAAIASSKARHIQQGSSARSTCVSLLPSCDTAIASARVPHLGCLRLPVSRRRLPSCTHIQDPCLPGCLHRKARASLVPALNEQVKQDLLLPPCGSKGHAACCDASSPTQNHRQPAQSPDANIMQAQAGGLLTEECILVPKKMDEQGPGHTAG